MQSDQTASDDGDTTSSSDDHHDDWQVGDAEKDLSLLRTAIIKSRAGDEREESERILLLDEFARLRRPLYPDLVRFVAAPVALALVFTSSVLVAPRRRLLQTVSARTIALGFLTLGNVHYWATAVISPLVLLLAKRRSISTSPRSRRDMDSMWDMEYEDPRTSCRDYGLCLLENWASSVCGAAALGLLGMISLFRRGAENLSTEAKVSPWAVSIALASIQLLTRLGAAASLHQYPALLFELRKADREKPATKFQAALKPKFDHFFKSLPLGFALDLTHLALAVCGGNIGLASSALSERPKSILFPLIAASLLGPLCHLVALRRILHVRFFTDMSLSCQLDDAATVLSPIRDNSRDGFKWRYWFRWRKPKRISRVIRTWIRDDFVLRGFSVDPRDGRYDSYLFENIPTEEASPGGVFAKSSNAGSAESRLPIWNRFAEDEGRGLYATKQDRSTWATLACEKMAASHQKDYDKKDFRDPLGVAVQQTFQIGLSYDFDHDTKLKQGEEPSIHRLRARAAKSAIRRYNEIPEIAKEILDEIKDPDERMKIGIELAQQAGDEAQYLTDSLLNIPTNAAAPKGKTFDAIKAISESDALSLKVPVPDPDSVVTSRGEVSPYQQSEGQVADPFLQEDYVKELLRISKYRIAQEKEKESSEEGGDFDGGENNIDDIDDDYVADRLRRSDADFAGDGNGEDQYFA